MTSEPSDTPATRVPSLAATPAAAEREGGHGQGEATDPPLDVIEVHLHLDAQFPHVDVMSDLLIPGKPGRRHGIGWLVAGDVRYCWFRVLGRGGSHRAPIRDSPKTGRTSPNCS